VVYLPPQPAAWGDLVRGLSDATPNAERFRACKPVRDAGVLPDDATLFLIGHAIQWMPPDLGPEPPEGEEEEEEGDDLLNRHTLATLRRFGPDDLAELYEGNRLEYDRRHERGRLCFFGPPDEELAAPQRAEGIHE
jgi:hypothetical protein